MIFTKKHTYHVVYVVKLEGYSTAESLWMKEQPDILGAFEDKTVADEVFDTLCGSLPNLTTRPKGGCRQAWTAVDWYLEGRPNDERYVLTQFETRQRPRTISGEPRVLLQWMRTQHPLVDPVIRDPTWRSTHDVTFPRTYTRDRPTPGRAVSEVVERAVNLRWENIRGWTTYAVRVFPSDGTTRETTEQMAARLGLSVGSFGPALSTARATFDDLRSYLP